MGSRGNYNSEHNNYFGRRKTLRDIEYSEPTRVEQVAHRRLLHSMDEISPCRTLIGPSVTHYKKPTRKK